MLEKEIKECRNTFWEKYGVYGGAWDHMHSEGLTDRAHTLAQSLYNDSRNGDAWIGVVNYTVMNLIQIQRKPHIPTSMESALHLYDGVTLQAQELMGRKEKGYGTAWYGMRVSGLSDLIIMKFRRVIHMQNTGYRADDEIIIDNLMDIINYALMAMSIMADENNYKNYLNGTEGSN